MIGAGVDLELLEHLPAEPVLGKHPADGFLDDELGLALDEAFVGLCLEAAGIAGEAGLHLLLSFGAGEDDFLSIGDDDEITGVNMRCVLRAVLAHEDDRDLNSHPAEALAFGVDMAPGLGDFVGFGEVSLSHCGSAFVWFR